MDQGQRATGRRRFIGGMARTGAAVAFCAWTRARTSGTTRPWRVRRSAFRRAATIERLGDLSRPAGNTLSVAWKAGPPSLDVQAGPSHATTSFACAVMSGLLRFRLDPDPRTSAQHILEPDLAASWEAPDAMHWILHLRPDATFQKIAPVNGRSVESEDVHASFARAAQLAQGRSRAVPVTLDATTIETPDRLTVAVRLERPYAPLPQLLASVPAGLIYPRETLSGAFDPARTMIGSGPFSLRSYTPDVAVDLGRNESYFESGLPYLDGVRQAIIPSEDDQITQFTAGNLDVLRVGQSALPAATAGNPGAQVIQAIGDRNYAISFPVGATLPPFIDLRVRLAVSEAIDRDALGRALYGNQYDLAFSVNLSMGPWAMRFTDLNPRDQHSYTFDPADAAELLRAAGYTELDLKLAYPTGVLGPELETMAQMIAGMLSAVFGAVTPQSFDVAADDLSSGPRFGSLPPDTILLAPIFPFQNVDRYLADLYQFFSDPTNTEHFQDPQLDAMIDQARTQVDPELMRQSYLDVQKYLAGRFYTVGGLPVGYTSTLLQPWVESYSAPPEAGSAGRAWRTAQ